MGGPRWRELTVSLPALVERGADEALVEDVFHLFDTAGAPGAVAFEEERRVVAYLPDDERADAAVRRVRVGLERLRPSGLAVMEGAIEETDWAEAWKRFFHARRVGRRLIIRPSWELPNAGPEDVVIDLDPGQAFGTGDHPTTRLILELLERRVRAGDVVYDVGAGSGILAIAALKLGARFAAASDTDPAAVRVSAENLRRNGVADRAVVALADSLPWRREAADLVLTNIISATIIRLAPEAARALRPGGWWLVSGVIAANEAEVRRAVEANGMTVTERAQEGEWMAMAARR